MTSLSSFAQTLIPQKCQPTSIISCCHSSQVNCFDYITDHLLDARYFVLFVWSQCFSNPENLAFQNTRPSLIGTTQQRRSHHLSLSGQSKSTQNRKKDISKRAGQPNTAKLVTDSSLGLSSVLVINVQSLRLMQASIAETSTRQPKSKTDTGTMGKTGCRVCFAILARDPRMPTKVSSFKTMIISPVRSRL